MFVFLTALSEVINGHLFYKYSPMASSSLFIATSSKNNGSRKSFTLLPLL